MQNKESAPLKPTAGAATNASRRHPRVRAAVNNETQQVAQYEVGPRVLRAPIVAGEDTRTSRAVWGGHALQGQRKV